MRNRMLKQIRHQHQKTVTQPATSKAAVQKEPLVEPPVERPVAKQASVPTQKVEPAPADVEDDGFLADP